MTAIRLANHNKLVVIGTGGRSTSIAIEQLPLVIELLERCLVQAKREARLITWERKSTRAIAAQGQSPEAAT